MIFDPNQKNVAPMYLGTVHNGEITYRVATMEKEQAQEQPKPKDQPYARVGEDGVDYAGPHREEVAPGPFRVVLFGPKAAQVAQSPDVAWINRKLEFDLLRHLADCSSHRKQRVLSAHFGLGPGSSWPSQYMTPWLVSF